MQYLWEKVKELEELAHKQGTALMLYPSTIAENSTLKKENAKLFNELKAIKNEIDRRNEEAIAQVL